MTDSVQAQLEAVLRGIEATVAPHDADCIAAHSPHCDCTRPDRVRAEQARAVERMVEAAQNRIDALESLLVCYRVGRQPTEALHEKLQTSRETWAAALRAGEEHQ